jgi:BsuBI/PstI restriction endonuclease domain
MQIVKTLEKHYGKERDMRRIPVILSNGDDIVLLANRQNKLLKKVLLDLCALYAPAGRVLSVSGGAGKWTYFDDAALAELGVDVKEHGKMPDVLVHHVEKNRLFLIDAVGSHGPISPNRLQELKKLFAGSQADIIYVTTFLDRRTMIKYFDDIAWGTVVWIAETPTHLVHLDGGRLFGPNDD